MTNSPVQVSVLDYDSRAHQLHQPVIQELLDRAYHQRCITHRVRNKIFGGQGIVCATPGNTEAESVSKRFFMNALEVMNKEEAHKYGEIPESTRNMRALLEHILAAHFSVSEVSANEAITEPADVPYEGYKVLIKDLEDYCWDHDIPSIFPNLFLPKSLGKILESDVYDPTREHMMGMYERLVGLYMHQSRHLQSILFSLSRKNMHQQIVTLVEGVAEERREPVLNLLLENPVLAETYIITLYVLQRDDDVIQTARNLTAFFESEQYISEKYIGSVARKRDVNELMYLLNNSNILPLRNSLIERRLINACIDIGWELFGQGRYDELTLILNHIKHKRADSEQVSSLFHELKALRK